MAIDAKRVAATPRRSRARAVAPPTPGAIAGPGSTPHLSIELLRRMAGVDITVVPHQGGGPLIQNLVGGQVPLGFATSVAAIPRVKSGQPFASYVDSGYAKWGRLIAEAGIKSN